MFLCQNQGARNHGMSNNYRADQAAVCRAGCEAHKGHSCAPSGCSQNPKLHRAWFPCGLQQLLGLCAAFTAPWMEALGPEVVSLTALFPGLLLNAARSQIFFFFSHGCGGIRRHSSHTMACLSCPEGRKPLSAPFSKGFCHALGHATGSKTGKG